MVPVARLRCTRARRRSILAAIRPVRADIHAVCASSTLLTGITPSFSPSVA